MSSRDPRALEAAAAAIVAELTDDEPVSVRRLERGVMNIKFLVHVRDGPALVVRFYPASNAAAPGYEPDLLRRLHEHGMPVPRVLDSRSAIARELPYAVYEWLEGDTLNEWQPRPGQSRASVVRELAALLDEAGTIAVRGHGELVSATQARFDGWHAFMRSSFDVGIAAAREHATLPGALIADLAAIRGTLRDLRAPATHGLAWADIREEHVIVGIDGRIAGLVDFEGALGAEPALNLGYCRAWYGERGLARELADAWSAAGHEEDPRRVSLYAVLRGVRIAAFAHLPLPAGRARQPVYETLRGFAEAARQVAAAAS